MLGNGSNQYSLDPVQNIDVKEMLEEDPLNRIVKIDSADEYTGFSTSKQA